MNTTNGQSDALRDAVTLLQAFQSHLGPSRDRCGDKWDRQTWDCIDRAIAALASSSPAPAAINPNATDSKTIDAPAVGREAVRKALCWLTDHVTGAAVTGAGAIDCARNVLREILDSTPPAEAREPVGVTDAMVERAAHLLVENSAETFAVSHRAVRIALEDFAAQPRDTPRDSGDAEPLAWLVMYGERVVGWTNRDSKDHVRLAEGERLVPVAATQSPTGEPT